MRQQWGSAQVANNTNMENKKYLWVVYVKYQNNKMVATFLSNLAIILDTVYLHHER